MPNTGGGLGQGSPRGMQGTMGEGPGSTKGSRQKPVMPKLLKGNMSYQKQAKANKRLFPSKPFMPDIVTEVPRKR